MLNESLKYLALGWSIIPIRKGSKLPAISSWIEYQKRLPTAEEVKQWWEENPEANIALICGKISGIIVVDIDTPHGGDTKSLALSPTLVSKTGGGGFHYLYKYRQGLIGAKVGFWGNRQMIKGDISKIDARVYLAWVIGDNATNNHRQLTNAPAIK